MWSQEYILKKNANLRNYVVIGNEDAQDLANNTFGKVKQIKVEYVWFKVKKKQLLCTFNEFGMNYATIIKYMNADSEEFGTLIAESIDFRERNQIKEYHKFLSELSPSQISKVVSFAIILLILILTSS
jgi:hypothetical protein